jgi:hypothetical protein
MWSGSPSSNAVRFLPDRERGRLAGVAEFIVLPWDYCGTLRTKLRYEHRKCSVKSRQKS